MSEVEEEERTGRDWARIIIPRVIRAVIWGFIMGGEALLLLNLPQLLPGMEEGAMWMEMIPAETTANLSYFFILFAGIEVTIQLLRGTVFPYALSMARSIISMILLVQMTNGGVMTITMQPPPGSPIPEGASIILTLDFQPVLAVILLIALLSVIKNLLQAVDYLSKREEEGPPPELP